MSGLSGMRGVFQKCRQWALGRERQHVPVAETESVYATRNDVVFVCRGTLTEYLTMDGLHNRNAFPHKSGN